MKRSRNAAPGIVYDPADVSCLLQLPFVVRGPVPDANHGEIVIYYGGWSLKELRECRAGQHRMRQDETWYDNKVWKADPGYYRLLLPVPSSNRKNWHEQLAHLRTIDDAWQPAAVAIAATALLVHLTATGNDLIRNDWCRCAELILDGDQAVLTVSDGRLWVDDSYGNVHRYGGLWLAAAQKC